MILDQETIDGIMKMLVSKHYRHHQQETLDGIMQMQESNNLDKMLS